MYDFSGEWAFRIGLPARSGVSGAIMVGIPNVMGFCTWSPRLDLHGNSVRASRSARSSCRGSTSTTTTTCWGACNTPADDADRGGHAHIAALLHDTLSANGAGPSPATRASA